MCRIRLFLEAWFVLGLACGLSHAEPLPVVTKEPARGSLDGYESYQVHPDLQFPQAVPAPFEMSWTLGPDMHLVVKGGVAGVLNNHLVIVPGVGFSGYYDRVQALDLSTMEWTGLPRIPKPPGYTTGVVARNSIIVLSGKGGVYPYVGASVQRLQFMSGNWVWDELPPLPRQIWSAGSACVDDRWVVISNGNVGLGEAPDQVSRQVWVLDLDNPGDGWQAVSQYENGVIQPMLAGLDGKVYFFGGTVYDRALQEESQARLAKGMGAWNDGYLRQKSVYRLDLATGTWRRCVDMPYPRSGGVALTYQGRYILIFGGRGHSGDHNSVRPGVSKPWTGYHHEVLLYDTQEDMWSVFSRPMPYGTNIPQAAASGETIYVAGGEPSHGLNNNTEDVVMIGAIPSIPPPAYWHTELTAGGSTMALWRFNEGQGTVANDVGGSINNAATLVAGASFASVGVTDHGWLHAPADFGHALSLDGSTGYAIVSDSPELEFPGFPLTVEFWIKPAAKSWQRVMSKYTTQHRSWEIVITHDSNLEPGDRFGDNAYHLYFRAGPGVESLEMREVAATPIVPGQWQFVALVFDVAGSPHVYINGVESQLKSAWGATVDSLSQPLLDSPVPLGFGAYDAGDTESSRIISYSGLIDEVRVSKANVVP